MPTLSSPRARLAAVATLLVVAFGCDAGARRAERDADDRFARTYIRTLHDSGVSAVLGRTKRESAAVPAFALGVDAMRLLLPASLDTVQLVKADSPADSSSDTTAAGGMHLVYRVRGGGQGAEVQVWVDREQGQPVVDQIRVARQDR